MIALKKPKPKTASGPWCKCVLGKSARKHPATMHPALTTRMQNPSLDFQSLTVFKRSRSTDRSRTLSLGQDAKSAGKHLIPRLLFNKLCCLFVPMANKPVNCYTEPLMHSPGGHILGCVCKMADICQTWWYTCGVNRFLHDQSVGGVYVSVQCILSVKHKRPRNSMHLLKEYNVSIECK